VKPAGAPTLREVRRGESDDEIELVAEDGTVVILCAYGLHKNERARGRENAMRLLGGGQR
jgi:hypothetical protein